jgi:hypothetical protein
MVVPVPQATGLQPRFSVLSARPAQVWKIQAFVMGRRVVRVAIAVPVTFILAVGVSQVSDVVVVGEDWKRSSKLID